MLEADAGRLLRQELQMLKADVEHLLSEKQQMLKADVEHLLSEKQQILETDAEHLLPEKRQMPEALEVTAPACWRWAARNLHDWRWAVPNIHEPRCGNTSFAWPNRDYIQTTRHSLPQKRPPMHNRAG